MSPFVSVIPSPTPVFKWLVISHAGIEGKCCSNDAAVRLAAEVANFYCVTPNFPDEFDVLNATETGENQFACHYFADRGR